MFDKICLKPGQSFSIMQPSIETYSSLHVVINACPRVDSSNNPMYTGCNDLSQYYSFLNYFCDYYKFATASIILMNTFINPS